MGHQHRQDIRSGCDKATATIRNPQTQREMIQKHSDLEPTVTHVASLPMAMASTIAFVANRCGAQPM